MGNLPTARTETCIAGASVSHNLMNEIQDNIISINSRTLADNSRNTTALRGVTQSGTWTCGIGPTNERFMLSNGAANLIVPLDMRSGERIKSVTFTVWGDGAADVTATVFYTTSAMSASSIGTQTVTNQAASWGTFTIDVTDTQEAATELVDIIFVASANGIRLGNISYVVDHPPV